MQITSNPYSGYSQPQTQLFQPAGGLQQQSQQPQAETAANKYQDRVTLSGVAGNVSDFFFADQDPQLKYSFSQQQQQGEAAIEQHMREWSDSFGLPAEKRLEVKQLGAGEQSSFVVAGASVNEVEQLSTALNNDSDFKQRFSAAEQIKRLSVAIAKAKLYVETLANEGVVPQYHELQKIKDQVEQQFLAVSLTDGVVDFSLVD